MTAVQNLGYISFHWEKGMGSMTASQYIYICISYNKDHTSVGHRVHVKPVLDVSEFLSELMTRPNVTFPFWSILNIWPWFKKHNCVASVQASHGRFIARLWRTENVRENWEVDMTMWKWGKEFTTPFHIFFKKKKTKNIVLKDGPGND